MQGQALRVATTTALFFFLARFNKSFISQPDCSGQDAHVGSSSKRIGVSWASARANHAVAIVHHLILSNFLLAHDYNATSSIDCLTTA